MPDAGRVGYRDGRFKMGAFGGIKNSITANEASVVGGEVNLAEGRGSTISGADNHVTTEGLNGFVVGEGNTVSADNAAVSGGEASILGGKNNTASGARASVSGGEKNNPSGADSSILGGPNEL